MKRIMLATDFSERSDRALRRAALLAREHGATLELIHVVDDDRPRRLVEHEESDGRFLLNELSTTLAVNDGIASEIAIIPGDPFDGIVNATRERQPDLLVIGPHRRQILRDSFIGTTAERTIRSVDCPVLMVNGPPFAPYRHVMLTTDLSGAAAGTLQRYLDLGLAPKVMHSILHVFETHALSMGMSGTLPKADRDFYIAEQASEARRNTADFAGGLKGQRLEVIVRYLETTAANEIRKAAEEAGADLIVLSAHGKGALARMFLGSVTQQVLQFATVDVLCMPPGPRA